MLEFTDRVVLITGASGGLGSAVTRAFLDAGATVAGVFRSGAPPVNHDRFLSMAGDDLRAVAESAPDKLAKPLFCLLKLPSHCVTAQRLVCLDRF